MSSAGLVRVLVTIVVVAAIALCLPLLQSARGSYTAIVTIQFEDRLPGRPPSRYALTRHESVPEFIARHAAVEDKWRDFVVPCDERVRGAFSANWTWTGHRHRRFPYADVVLVEYQIPDEPPVYELFPIPWDAQNLRARVTIPTYSSNARD